jgi:hypothetical protein
VGLAALFVTGEILPNREIKNLKKLIKEVIFEVFDRRK